MQDSLGDRMKNYENSYRFTLPTRIPLIIRVDGKVFHSYTSKCNKPFDDNLIEAMNQVAINLCKEIQGAQFAYIQSDEISILVHNYKKLDSKAYFDNNKSKIESVSAAIASAVMTEESCKVFGKIKRAYFDARCFVLPEADVCNYFIWRQNDATRNSVQMLAYSLYSHKQLYKKNNSELQEMIFQKGSNWNNLPTSYKRGRCVEKVEYMKDEALRSRWEVNNEIPIFTINRNFIEKYLKIEQE